MLEKQAAEDGSRSVPESLPVGSALCYRALPEDHARS